MWWPGSALSRGRLGLPLLGLSGPVLQPPYSREQMPSVKSVKYFTLAGEPGIAFQGRSFIIIEVVLKMDLQQAVNGWLSE